MNAGCENTVKPLVEYFRCTVCGASFVTYSDMADVEGFCKTTLARWLQAHGSDARWTYDELLSHTMEECWKLYLAWDPKCGVGFAGWAYQYLPVRVNDWFKKWAGRGEQPKPLAGYVPLDQLDGTDDDGDVVYLLDRLGPDRLGPPVAGGPSTTPDDRPTDLLRVLAG